MRLLPLPSLHVAVLLFGGAGLFGKWIDLPPTTIVLGRVVFASITLGIVLKLADRGMLGRGIRLVAGPVDDAPGGPSPFDGTPGTSDTAPRADHVPAWRDRTHILVRPALGLLLAVHWVTFFQAIQVSSVAVALLTFATFPVFTALLEPLLPGERLDPGSVVASLVALAGIALVVPTPDLDHPVTQGAAWGVASGVTFAALSLANRGLVRRYGALRLALRQDTWAAFFLLPFLLTSGGTPSETEWVLLLLLGTVFTAVAHALFIHGLSGVRAGRAAVITTLEPVYGVALAALLLGERPEPRVLLGGAIVLATALWISRVARTRVP